MNTQTIKTKTAVAYGLFAENKIIAAIAAVVLFFLLAAAYLGIQNYLDKRAVERQQEQIKKYDDQTRASRAETERLIEAFDKTHASTIKLLDAMNAVSGVVNQLVENDRQFGAAVESLKGNYNDAKNGRTIIQNGKTIRVYAAPRPNAGLREREDDLLRNDEELYGAN